MSKIKTEQQQLSEDSENALRVFFSKFGWTVEFPRVDFGTDGKVLLFENGEYSGMTFDFQLKSTAGAENQEDMYMDDIDLWSKTPGPFFIFFWNKQENAIYFLDVHQYHGNLTRSDPSKLKQKTVRVKFSEKLNESNVDILASTVRSYSLIANEAIREHENKNAEIKKFLGQGRVVAMGYSFAGQNIGGQTLRGAALMGANFEDTTMTGSDMRSVSAMGANFNHANLRECDMRSASVMGAYFENADIRAAKLDGAAFMGSFVAGADFRGASFNEMSLWSLGKAYDYEKAKYDEGVLEKINTLKNIQNYSSGNAS